MDHQDHFEPPSDPPSARTRPQLHRGGPYEAREFINIENIELEFILDQVFSWRFNSSSSVKLYRGDTATLLTWAVDGTVTPQP